MMRYVELVGKQLGSVNESGEVFWREDADLMDVDGSTLGCRVGFPEGKRGQPWLLVRFTCE